MRNLKITHCVPVLALLAAGCSEEVRDESQTGAASAYLLKAESCEHLESMLKQDALAKMNAQIDAQIYWLTMSEGGVDNGGVVGTSSATGGATAGSGGGSLGAPEAGDDDAAGDPEFSETNTQVEGVDEADIVKTDGNYLYILHGQQLAIVNAFPASELGVGGLTAIEGQPLEMFLAGDNLVVYSSVDAAKVFEEAGVELPEQPNGGGAYPDGPGGYYYHTPMTKITVLGLNGNQASVQDELYFEGGYSSARRIGSQVRTVLSGGHHGPNVQTYPYYDYEGDSWPESSEEWIAAYEQLRLENTTAIVSATLDDFLPSRFARDGGELTALGRSCESYYVPGEGTTEYGLTQVQAFDLENIDAGIKEANVVGRTDTVYSSHDAMYLAARGWHDGLWGHDIQDDDVVVSMQSTHVHKFDIASDPSTPKYVASGTVRGSILNQFSLDELDGKLRMATTDTLASASTWDSVNHLFVLEQDGADLRLVGGVTNLAPGEQVYSARFVGERGYVVTFRQVDPLFVFDLANPADPQLLAELKIPGFSEYMHPLEGGTHLLTIGRDGTDDGQVTDPALQIFDVSDPRNPKLAHKHVLPSGHSEASYNHKAFTFYKGTLAIPFSSWEDGWSSTLELFSIDVDAGIAPLGGVDHSPFFTALPEWGYCGYYGTDVRRGVFIDEYIYSISHGGVMVNQSSDLAPVASVALPDLQQSNTDCYGGGWGGEG